MKWTKVALLMLLIPLAACGRGNGIVIGHGIIPGHMDVTTSCFDGCKRTIMIPYWVSDQPYLIVQGIDKGTSQEHVDREEYALCLLSPNMQYPECLEQNKGMAK